MKDVWNTFSFVHRSYIDKGVLFTKAFSRFFLGVVLEEGQVQTNPYDLVVLPIVRKGKPLFDTGLNLGFYFRLAGVIHV